MEILRPDDFDELLAGLYNGDQKSQNRLFKLFYPYLLDFAMDFVHKEDAKEIAVTSLHKLFNTAKKRQSFKRFNQVITWLNIATRNQCFTLLRFNKKRPLQNVEDIDNCTELNPTVIEKIIEFEVINEFRRMIENLPDREKEVVRLYHEEQLNTKEIAKKLNITASSVRSSKANAQNKLRILFPKKRWLLIFLLITCYNPMLPIELEAKNKKPNLLKINRFTFS